MASAEFQAFLRILNNGPADNTQQDLTIQYQPTNGLISLTRGGVSYQTQYIFELSDLDALDVTAHTETEVHRVSRDILLVCNLNLDRLAFSAKPMYPDDPPDISLDPTPSDVEIIEQPSGNKQIRMTETLRMSEELAIVLKNDQTSLSEDVILRTLPLLRKFDRHGLSETAPIAQHNLAEALESYERAMSQADRIEIFKSLYVSLEKATNYDGDDATGGDFDQKVAQVAGTISGVEELRRTYSRFKHVDRNQTEKKRRLAAEANLPTALVELRKLTATHLLSVLRAYHP